MEQIIITDFFGSEELREMFQLTVPVKEIVISDGKVPERKKFIMTLRRADLRFNPYRVIHGVIYTIVGVETRMYTTESFKEAQDKFVELVTQDLEGDA